MYNTAAFDLLLELKAQKRFKHTEISATSMGLI